MMDICTLVIITTMNLNGCARPSICVPSVDGTRQYCSGFQPFHCPIPEPFYNCVKPDGTIYTLKQSEAK